MRALLSAGVLIVLSIGVVVAAPSSSPAGAAATSFAGAERIDDDAHMVARNAAADVDSVGNAVAVWQFNGVIYGSRRPVGGSWSTPQQLIETFVVDPDVVALGEDGAAYFDVGMNSPEGDGIVVWSSDNTVDGTTVFGEGAAGRVAADRDGDVVAYTESANSLTTYHFAAAGTDPVSDGWSSATKLRAFGSSRVTFGSGHTYYVAYPPDSTGTDRRFRVDLVHGTTGDHVLLIHRRLCPSGSGRLAGYNIAAGRFGAVVLAWRCTSRTADVIDVQRISRTHRIGAVVQIARSRLAGVTGRLSAPAVAQGPGSATVLFSRATGANRRDILAVSTDSDGMWRRPRIKVRDVVARSAAAMTAQLDWSPDGAALLTYRNGGFDGTIWALRRLPGTAFRAPVQVFPGSARIRLGAVAANGAALVVRLKPDDRFVGRFAPA